MNKDKPLIFDADFDLAMIIKFPVIVWLNGEIHDYGGIVEDYNEDVVKINGSYFFRKNCEFKVR